MPSYVKGVPMLDYDPSVKPREHCSTAGTSHFAVDLLSNRHQRFAKSTARIMGGALPKMSVSLKPRKNIRATFEPDSLKLDEEPNVHWWSLMCMKLTKTFLNLGFTLSYHILIASLSSGTPLVPLAILACVSQGVVNVKHDGRNLPLELKVLHRLQSCVRSIKDMSKVDGIATLWRINHVAVVRMVQLWIRSRIGALLWTHCRDGVSAVLDVACAGNATLANRRRCKHKAKKQSGNSHQPKVPSNQPDRHTDQPPAVCEAMLVLVKCWFPPLSWNSGHLALSDYKHLQQWPSLRCGLAWICSALLADSQSNWERHWPQSTLGATKENVGMRSKMVKGCQRKVYSKLM